VPAVKPFAELSDAGKLRRVRVLAHEALRHYDLARPTLAFHAFATNLLYRVRSASGERFILRLAFPGWRTLEDHRAEAAWLDALARDTTVGSPRVVPSRSGEAVLPLASPAVHGTWDATLMTYLPGRLLGHHLSPSNLSKLGALFAELHHHGANWTPPAGFSRRRFEHWLSRGEPNRIIAGDGDAPPEAAALPAAHRAALADMERLVEAAYGAVDRRDLRVIHCDLWHDNVKLHRGRLHPFDFEDTVWGFRAHDIAMAMLDLLEATDEQRYPALLVAFRSGYQAHLAWPSEAIEPFQLGRLLWMANWVARHEPSNLAGTVERHVAVFEHYRRTGRLVGPARG
jgi:Ser/Thr protein kinase RdoA (MazF antagonist)